MARLAGKVMIVTGAALGLGAAIAKLSAREGARMVLTDVKDQEGHSLADSLPGSTFIHHDVAIEDQWKTVIAQTLDQFGRLDVLVNNAGVGKGCPPDEQTLEEWRWLMSINLDGVFLGTKHAINAMKQKKPPGGSIIKHPGQLWIYLDSNGGELSERPRRPCRGSRSHRCLAPAWPCRGTG